MNIRRQKNRRKVEVNIVPLIDVFTVLIFFFLLTMQFKDIYAVDITPPNMLSATTSQKQKPSTIAIDKDGKYYFNTKQSTIENLKSELKKYSENDDASLILLVDKEADFHFIAAAIDLVKIHKIKKLSIQTDK